jgi:hypothetical protein
LGPKPRLKKEKEKEATAENGSKTEVRPQRTNK